MSRRPDERCASGRLAYDHTLLFQSLLTAPDAIFDQDRSRLEPLAADLADVADVAEGWGHPARPAADFADIATDVADTGADSTPIPTASIGGEVW